jgi:succinoglycan biosynthesis transport protein ExoP
LPNLVIRSNAAPAVESEPRPITLAQQYAIDDGIGLDRCWLVIRRHWRMIATIVSVAVILARVVVSLMTPEYTAKSTLLIEPEPPRVLDVAELMDAAGGTQDHDYYNTQFELLKSQRLASRVISDLDLAHNPIFNSVSLQVRIMNFALAPLTILSGDSNDRTQVIPAKEEKDLDRSDTIEHYLAGLKVTPVAGSQLVTVSYTAPDRSLAARIVDRHVRDYVQMGIDLRAQAGKRAQDFLARQLVGIGRQVQKSEAALNSYRDKMGIVSFGVDEKNTVAAQRLADLNRTLTEVETKRLNAQAQMMLVQAGNYDSLPQVVNNPAILALEPQVRNLQAEYARLSTAFNPGYPKLDELKAQMDAAQRALNVQIRDVAQAVRRSYLAADTEEKRLQAEINAEKTKDLAINDASLRDAVLVRAVETNRQLYKNVLQRMQEMAVTQPAPLSNISIVDDAVASRFPSEPRKVLDTCIVGLLALLSAVGLTFFKDYQDDRFHSLEEVEEFLGLPSLAMVPDFARLRSLSSRGRRLSLRFAQAIQGRVTNERPMQSIEYHPSGDIARSAEIYRMIRTALLFSRAGSPPRTIAVSSAIKGEGKTATVANTAVAFARACARTLLIDADLRRPSCHSLMNEANHVGLSDLLTGQIQLDEAIRATTIEHLFLLTAGSAVPNPAELLTSNVMRETLDALRYRFDMVLIDTAPLMLASDTCAMVTMVDGVVLVVGADTPKRNTQRAYQRLQYVGAKILGVVLNRVDIYAPGHDEFLGYYRSYGGYERAARR